MTIQVTPQILGVVAVTSPAAYAAAAAASAANAASLLAGVGYWTLHADSSTTFPARSTIPSWWTGPVLYDSTAYLNHADPADPAVGDQHLKRTA